MKFKRKPIEFAQCNSKEMKSIYGLIFLFGFVISVITIVSAVIVSLICYYLNVNVPQYLSIPVAYLSTLIAAWIVLNRFKKKNKRNFTRIEYKRIRVCKKFCVGVIGIF